MAMTLVNGTLAWVERPLNPKGLVGQRSKVATQDAASAVASAAAASAAAAAAVTAAAIDMAAGTEPTLPPLSRELLERVACPGPFVIVTTTNFHYRQVTESWFRSLHEAGVPCTLVGALDARVAAWLKELGEAAFDISASLPAAALGWGTPNFHKLGRHLVHIIETVLESNVTMVLSDSDQIWLRDPRPFFERYPQADALFSSDMASYTEQEGCGDPAKAIQPLDWTLAEGEEGGDGGKNKEEENKDGEGKEKAEATEESGGAKDAGGKPASPRSSNRSSRRRLFQQRSSNQQVDVVEATDEQGPEDNSINRSATGNKTRDAEGSSSSNCVEHLEPAWYRRPRMLNIGIALYRPSALPLVQAWRDALNKSSKAWDQKALNDLVKANVTYEREDGLFGGWDGRLRVGVLPVLLFCSGHTYFVQKAPQMRGITPYVVHATFQVGSASKTNRFREAGLWSDQIGGERFDAKPGFLEIEERVPRVLLHDAHRAAERATGTLENTGPHFALVHHQLRTLRQAYAVASALSSRALVLPPMISGQDRYRLPHKGTTPGSKFDLPFVSPADYVLDLERWTAKAAGPSFREAGFLDRPAARSLATSRITLWVCKSREEALAERAKVQGDGDDAREADEKLKLELACAGNPVQDDVLEEKKRQISEVEEKKLRWWEDPYHSDPVYSAVDVTSATYKGIAVPFYDENGAPHGDVVRVIPGLTLAQLGKLAQVTASYAIVTVRPPGAIERLLAPTDAEAERIREEFLPLTSQWCCVKGRPGHVWYDPYYDVIPHTDRHGRVWNETWKPTTGP